MAPLARYQFPCIANSLSRAWAHIFPSEDDLILEHHGLILPIGQLFKFIMD